jgi:pSer/pThr/pTyr-binding forkhead associated (FHA) protein
VRIGRLPESEIPLADPNVSRNHAEVRPAGAGYEVADVGSTNGTKVNGAIIAGPHQLNDGDEISVGAAKFRFEAS